MDEYKEYIANLAKQDKNAIVYNSSSEHASIVMGTMFENAKNIMKIYAGGFTGEISNRKEYKLGLEHFLRRGGKLQILLQKDKIPNDTPEIFNTLHFFSIINPTQIIMKKHPYKIRMEKDASSEIHFAVGDNKMYRIEEDINNFTAKVNFNDTETSEKLSKIFDDIFNDKSLEIIPV